MAKAHIGLALTDVLDVGVAQTAFATPDLLTVTTIDGLTLEATGADVLGSVETLKISNASGLLLTLSGLNLPTLALFDGFNTADLLSQDDEIFGTATADTILGMDGNDIVDGGHGDDVLSGGNGHDKLGGNGGEDEILGGDGSDTLVGGGGNDMLLGGAGNDTLNGDDANDSLSGGLGLDALTGGNGTDRFEFRSAAEAGNGTGKRDVITDFQRGADKIDLHVIDANGAAKGNTAFQFEGLATKFSGHAGALIYSLVDKAGSAGGRTIIAGDINGDQRADLQIELKSLFNLKAGDFML